MTKIFLVKEKEGKLLYSDALLLKSPESLKIIEHDIRLKILKLLNENPTYPSDLAKKLGMHEQKVYYHIKQLMNAGILEVVERKEIRGTVAKKLRPKEMNFAVALSENWSSINKLIEKEKDKKLESFLNPFIKDNKLNAKIVVGSPDAHGPFKARARDGHYAIDLAVFLGNSCDLSKNFAVSLDVDINLKEEKSNLIVVGGPVTNLVMQKINDFLPAKFSDKKPWGIEGKQPHTEDNIGLIARIPNPYNPEYKIIALAGIRFSGTKSTVIGLTRFTKQILNRFTDQKEFYAIVEGFDLDGDGKIDSIEVIE